MPHTTTHKKPTPPAPKEQEIPSEFKTLIDRYCLRHNRAQFAQCAHFWEEQYTPNASLPTFAPLEMRQPTPKRR